jgi:bifunctional oligoribonuclease and PAP phosphatase NrnA
MNEWWDQLRSKIKHAEKVGILTHKDPDGDGLSVALILKKYLTWHEIKSEIILEEQAPHTYNYLHATENTKIWESNLSYDFLLILDCHEESRLGVCSSLLKTANTIFILDHHERRDIIPNATYWIDASQVSVGVMLHHCIANEIHSAPCDIQKYYAQCIYTSILNDTDNFINSNTDHLAFQTSSDLMKFGLKPSEVAQSFLFNKPPLEMKFIGEVLSTIEIHKNGKVLFMDSTLEMLEKYYLDQSATSKLTRWVKGLDGIEVIVYFREVETEVYRLSLRSVHIAVNKIAEIYGGGGHILAAGCNLTGTLSQVKQMILDHLNML